MLQVTSYKSHTQRVTITVTKGWTAGPKKTIIWSPVWICLSQSQSLILTCNANDAMPFLLGSSSLAQVDRQRFRCGSCQPTPCAHAGHVIALCASNAQCEATGPTILHLVDPSWQRYVGQVAGFSMNSTLRHKVQQRSPVQSNRRKMITQDTATTGSLTPAFWHTCDTQRNLQLSMSLHSHCWLLMERILHRLGCPLPDMHFLNQYASMPVLVSISISILRILISKPFQASQVLLQDCFHQPYAIRLLPFCLLTSGR